MSLAPGSRIDIHKQRGFWLRYFLDIQPRF